MLMVAIRVGAMMALLVKIVFDGESARFLGTLVTVKCAPNNHIICLLAERMYGMVASP
jgi:regulator of RNase E activity RraA